MENNKKARIDGLISVVIPTYNHGQFIGEAMESVLQQTYKNIELIIVDNHSNDNTENIVNSFLKSNTGIKYFKFSNNGVIAASRNYGIKESSGEYIAFLDSDDKWDTEKIASQIRKLSEDPDFGLVFCSFRVESPIKENDCKILGPKEKNIEGFAYNKLLNYNFVISSSVLLRACILDDVGVFDEDATMRCVEDFDLWLRIAKKYKIAGINNVSGTYRMHSINCNEADQRLKRAFKVIDRQRLFGFASEKQIKRAKANFYFREGWFFIEDNAREARRYFLNAMGLNWVNPKILVLSFAGFLLSLIPSLYRLIRKSNIDKKIAKRVINPQNL